MRERTIPKNAPAIVTVVLILVQSLVVASQGQPAVDAKAQMFEVASVRANKSGPSGFAPLQVRPNGSVVATNVPLRGLIMFAYGLATYESIEGGGNDLEERFDVVATAAGPQVIAPPGELGPLNIMMQNLLSQRFGLVIRWEERPGAGYVLARSREDGKLGPGIRPSDLECPRITAKLPDDKRSCDMQIIDNVLNVEGHRMADFAQLLARFYERPVADRTGLEGWFTFRLRFNARELPLTMRLLPALSQRTVDSGLPSLFTALQEELGLKLEPQRVTMRALIVEQVHALTEN